MSRKNSRAKSKRKTIKRTKTEKKNGKVKRSVRDRISEEVASETLKSAAVVLLAAFAVVFFMAGFSLAGRFGTMFYEFAHGLLGFGYYLIPVSMLLLASAMYKTREKKTGVLRSVSILIFAISGLALMELFSEGLGGVVGGYVLHPVVYAFDKVAGGLILVSVAAASIFVAFDTHPMKLFTRQEQEDDVEDESFVQDKLQLVKETVKQSIPKKNTASKKEPAKETETQNGKESKIVGNIKTAVEKTKNALDINTESFQSGNYTSPPISLLKKDRGRPSVGDVKANANRIKQTLSNFKVPVEMDEITIGPTVTRYAMKPAEGVRLSKILSLQSNLELALAASPIRIEAPIPGKSLVGIEVPNNAKTTLGLANIISSPEFASGKVLLPLALGKDIMGTPKIADLAKAPHMLIAGATGAGKSVTIHDLLISLLYKYGPDKLRLIMVDPKRVELTLYNGIPHLLTPVIVDAKKTILTLKWLISEMERRYDILEQFKVQNLKSYHGILEKELAKDPEADMEALPYIVTVLDELADIMQLYPKELESAIVRIAQKARAVGIHLILATQRPDVRTITGLIKANIPTRIALQVPSQIDSRTILDQSGAEKLLGAGDMLFLSGNMSKPIRVQAPFVSTQEIKEVVKFISKNFEGDLQDEINLEDVGKDSVAFSSGNLLEDEEDERNSDEYKAVLEFVISAKKASTSLLQRKFRIGYNKAARFIDMMEEDGIIGPQNGSKPREVLVDSLDEGATTENEDIEDDTVDLIDSDTQEQNDESLMQEDTNDNTREYDEADNEVKIRYNSEE